jgi:hypothetical protein
MLTKLTPDSNFIPVYLSFVISILIADCMHVYRRYAKKKNYERIDAVVVLK